MNDVNAVLAANAAFYDAHESRDLAAMQAVWEHSDRVACTHPGWPIL
ncbi:MAG: nuclear transport factor 2 family protein, partial [Actinomycetota bacterium]|nr:nuclear transport factor 2 family protein [Actinomycetota bacterium]